MNKKRLVKRLTVAMLAMGLLGMNIKAMAEVAAESRKLSILSVKGSNGAVIKGGTREISATAGMRLAQGNKVKTGASTQIYLEADDDKVMKLDSLSTAEITGVSSKKLKITLKSGSLFFQVDRKLAEEEELTFDAAQTSMSIRGTGGILSFQDGKLVFSLAEGEVDWQIGNETVHVNAGEQVVLGEVENGNALDRNGMHSVYELDEKKELMWRDLDAFGLEVILENEDRMDLSAIGYNPEENRQEALELLQKRQAEERQAEENRQRQVEETGPERGNSSVQRQDGRPATERNGSSNSSRRTTAATKAPETTKPTETKPTETEPTATKPTNSTTEPTAAEPSSTETKPSSTETKPSSTETKPSSTETEPSSTETKPSSTEPSSKETKPSSTEPESSSEETKPSSTETESSSKETESSSEEPESSSTDIPTTTGPNGTYDENGSWIQYNNTNSLVPTP